MKLRRPRARTIVAFVGGAVFAASSPPIDLPVGILVGLALFAWSLDAPIAPAGPTAPGAPAEPAGPAGRASQQRLPAGVGGGLWRGLLFGFGANLVALRFVPGVLARFTPLPAAANALALVLLSLAQALPWAMGGALAGFLAHRARALPSPVRFATGVYAATFVPAVFPWTPAGGLATWPDLLQLSELVGERGTCFVLALAVGLIAHAGTRLAKADRRGAGIELALGIAILGLLSATGRARMNAVEAERRGAPRARVALVQPGFDASDRWEASRAQMMIERLTSLTKGAEKRGAELVVWPESAYPYTLPHETRREPGGPRAVLQDGVRGPVLTGAYMKGEGAGYNSAILVTPEGSIGKPYDKRHLLWFGEMVPLSDVFPVLARIFAKGTGLAPGTESVILATRGIRAAVLNCYEDTLPSAGREAMEGGPNLLVNITNDAWFAGSMEGELHLRLAVLRAIEARRDLVRAVNQGPTSFVDATGRVAARTTELFPATLSVEAALLDTPKTIYTRTGDAPLFTFVTLFVLVAVTRGRRQNASSAAPAKEAALDDVGSERQARGPAT